MGDFVGVRMVAGVGFWIPTFVGMTVEKGEEDGCGNGVLDSCFRGNDDR